MITRTAKLAAVFGLTLLTLSAAAGFAHHDGAPGLRRARRNPWLAIGASLIGGLLDNTHRTPPVGCPGGNPGYPPNQQQQGWGDHGQNQQQQGWGGYGKQGQNQQQQGWGGYGKQGQNQQQQGWGGYGKQGQNQQQQGGWYW